MEVINIGRYACPCCGYRTLPQKPPGTYYICDICFWEDDAVQYYDPDYIGGANQENSLRSSQKDFMKDHKMLAKLVACKYFK